MTKSMNFPVPRAVLETVKSRVLSYPSLPKEADKWTWVIMALWDEEGEALAMYSVSDLDLMGSSDFKVVSFDIAENVFDENTPLVGREEIGGWDIGIGWNEQEEKVYLCIH